MKRRRPKISDRITAALDLSMADDSESRRSAVAALQAIYGAPGLGVGMRARVESALAQALQRIGDYHSALELIEKMNPPLRAQDAAMRDYWRARSLERLARFDEAVEAFEAVMPRLRTLFPDHFQYHLIEFGRAYSMARRPEDALLALREAVDIFEARGDDEEHLLRARSSIGVELLKSPDPGRSAEGEKILYETSDGKALVGDMEGLTNNYSTLSLHYAGSGRWERAIAFARRDLKLTRLIGDEHQLCATLGNMAVIYIQTLQLSAARRCLEEAREIGLRLGQAHTLRMVEQNLAAAQEAGRHAGKRGALIGECAPCACSSGKVFKDCCGRADFEPDTPLINFDETPNSQGLIYKNLRPRDANGRLDMILSLETRDRFSWTTVEGHDGWISVSELPDVSNYHLNAARNLAHQATGTSRFDEPLAVCLLSVCAAEAFANTLCYFVSDTARASGAHPASLLGKAATIVGDPLAYQRGTELTAKWAALGEALAGKEWTSQATWRAFKILVATRNELVHFKAVDFEQVSPAPKHLHEILRRLPPEIELRDVPHSWPARLLTASFARWCVATVERLIDDLKAGYANEIQ
jgi:tetratricopeptide (TPR) repeat protein